MSLARLRRGEIVAAAGAIALLVLLFAFPWYGDAATSLDGWHAHTVLRWLMLLTILAALALALLTATQRTPAVPVTVAVVVTALAALLLVLLAIRVLIDQPGAYGIGDVCAGAWLGLAASAAILRGAYLSMRDERTKPAAPPPPSASAPPAPTPPAA